MPQEKGGDSGRGPKPPDLTSRIKSRCRFSSRFGATLGCARALTVLRGLQQARTFSADRASRALARTQSGEGAGAWCGVTYKYWFPMVGAAFQLSVRRWRIGLAGSASLASSSTFQGHMSDKPSSVRARSHKIGGGAPIVYNRQPSEIDRRRCRCRGRRWRFQGQVYRWSGAV